MHLASWLAAPDDWPRLVRPTLEETSELDAVLVIPGGPTMIQRDEDREPLPAYLRDEWPVVVARTDAEIDRAIRASSTNGRGARPRCMSPGTASSSPRGRGRWPVRLRHSSHAKIRCIGKQAMATLKGWCLLRKIRCSTNRITDIAKTVLVLHHAST